MIEVKESDKEVKGANEDVSNMILDEIWAMVKADIDKIGIDNKEDCVNYIKELMRYMNRYHASDRHKIFRDFIAMNKNKLIQECKLKDVKQYQELQDMMLDAKQSFDHDNTMAKMLDVDKAISKAYGITLKMIRISMDTNTEKFNKLASAINKIEEHLGIDVTNFNEEEVISDDTTKSDDVQRDEKTT